jgi:hypothetical protein
MEKSNVEKELHFQALVADNARFKKEKHLIERRMVDMQVCGCGCVEGRGVSGG